MTLVIGVFIKRVQAVILNNLSLINIYIGQKIIYKKTINLFKLVDCFVFHIYQLSDHMLLQNHH